VLVDTHAHLDFEDFAADRDEVLRRAAGAGVRHVIVPGIDIRTSIRAIDLAETHDMVFAAVGIHPNDSHRAAPGDMDEIRRLAQHPRVVALGETGLDFYRDRAPRDVQARLFREHLDLARDIGLPVIVHFRNVESDGVDLIGSERFLGIRGVFHCFGGSVRFAEKVMEMGWYIGFTGPLTYKGSDRTAVARSAPLKRILVETDSPFLAPQGHRGERNEPAYVAEIANKLAEIKGIRPPEAIAATGLNVRELFGIGA
jgi:TatD DNase family protein